MIDSYITSEELTDEKLRELRVSYSYYIRGMREFKKCSGIVYLYAIKEGRQFGCVFDKESGIGKITRVHKTCKPRGSGTAGIAGTAGKI